MEDEVETRQTFEREVLIRLKVIETKLDEYKEVKEASFEAITKARQNEKEIEELKDKQKWLSRTLGGAIITAVVGIVIIYLKLGMGVS